MTGSNSKLVLVLAIVAAAGLALFFGLFDGGGAAPAPVGPQGNPEGVTAPPESTGDRPPQETGDGTQPAHRAEVAETGGDPELDPVIRAALCGFRGRVVDHAGAPMPELAVELYRFGPDTLVGARPDATLEAVLGEKSERDRAITGADGTFRITGQWPEAFYVMLAGVGAEATRLVVIDHMPGPGEIVDLGDIVIDLTGTIVGRVVDDDGEPLPGALVRAADIPGAFTAMVPLERFDPKGAIIVSESAMKRVIEFPTWFARAYERLPIPRTTSGPDGGFRLTGVAGGNNLLAVTAPDRLSYVEPRLPVEAGKEKDVGDIRLREGDEVWGRVVDSKGGPVAGAQVMVAQTSAIGPIAFASWTQPTDQKGEFSMTGFRGGKVIGAARRQSGDPWVITDPQPVARDLLIQLPGAFQLMVRAIAGGGAPVEDAELKLIPGGIQSGMAPMTRFGFFPAADLEDRVKALGEGRYVIDGLAAGSYRLEVTAPGYDTATADIELVADLTRTVQLEPVSTAEVVVVDEHGEPIRNAAVHAQADGDSDLPAFCGRTDSKGHFSLCQVAAGPVRVFAHHPAYGWASGRAQLPAEEIRLVMKAPGTLRGVLTEDGEIPEIGKYMIIVMRQGSDDDVGSMPRLVAPDPRGAFQAVGLQPGTYRLQAVRSIRAVKTLGSMFDMARWEMFGGGGGTASDVVVRSQLVAETEIDVRTSHEPVEGPSAQVRGTVLINGRPGTNMTVVATAGGSRAAAEVDATGRFDLGAVEAGSLRLRVFDTRESSIVFMNALWEQTYELQADRDLEAVIDLSTGALSGHVVGPDGSSAGRCEVKLEGATAAGGGEPARVRLGTASDDAGTFHFDEVPAGTYSVRATSQLGRGGTTGIQVVAGASTGPIEVRLQRTFRVAGSIRGTAFGPTRPSWVWVTLQPVESSSSPERRERSGGAKDDFTFEVGDVSPGRYRAEISAVFPDPESGGRRGGESRDFVHEGVIEVTNRDVQGLILVPVPKKPEREEANPEGKR